MKRLSAQHGLAAALVLLAACNPSRLSEPDYQVIEEVTFAPSLGINLALMTRTTSGLYYEDLVVGGGNPALSGDRVEVAYTGYLTTGTVFDSGSFGFTLGANEVVPGFDEGVTGMQVGGQRRIIIPPALGYGASVIGSIPAGSILIFDVELISIVGLPLS